MILPARPDRRRLVSCLLIIALALLTNYLFTGEVFHRGKDLSPFDWGRIQQLAVVALLGVVVLSAFSFGKGDDFRNAGEAGPALPCANLSVFEKWGLIAAALLYVAALLLYALKGETALVHKLWFGSIIALIVPLCRRCDISDFWPVPFWEYSLVVIITFLAFLLRYVDLTQLPYHIDNDVSIMGLFSKKLAVTGDWRWIGMAQTDHQLSEHQVQAVSMRLFGANHFGLVMLSVIVGTASVPLVYLLGKLLYNRWVGLISGALLAINYVHIHFSRIVFGPMVTFSLLLAGLLLLHAIKRRNALSFALGGVAIGFGLLGYYSGRVGPEVCLALFGVWLLQRKRFPGTPLYYWGLAVAGALVVFGPNLIYGIEHFGRLHGRGRVVIIWNHDAWNYLAYKYHGGFWAIIGQQIKRTLLTPFYFPDESIICYLRRPMLGILAGCSFAVGLGYCLRRLRDVGTVYILLWLGLTFLFGGILTIDPPFWPHLNIAVPALVLIAGIGLERCARRLVGGGMRPVQIVIPSLVAVLLFAQGLQNWNTYYSFASVHATDEVHATRQIERLSPGYKVYIISESIHWGQETFQFLNPQVEGRDATAKELYDGTITVDKPTVFFVFSDADQELLKFLAEKYPWSGRRLYRNGWQWPAFTMVRVLPPGYVDVPQDAPKAEKMFWNLPGGTYVLTLIGLVVFAGALSLKREFALGGTTGESQPRSIEI